MILFYKTVVCIPKTQYILCIYVLCIYDLFPHPVVFVTNLWILRLYVYVCMYVQGETQKF